MIAMSVADSPSSGMCVCVGGGGGQMNVGVLRILAISSSSHGQTQ